MPTSSGSTTTINLHLYFTLQWWQSQRATIVTQCVHTWPRGKESNRVALDGAVAGRKHATSNQSQVQRPYHCATEPHATKVYVTNMPLVRKCNGQAGQLPLPTVGLVGQTIHFAIPTKNFYTAYCKSTAQPAARSHILKLKCTKFDFGWALPQTMLGELKALPQTHSWISAAYV